jgi:predicted NBD/HSP70 family sugar kinase
MAEKRPAGTPVLRRMNTAAVLRAVRDRAPEPVRITELGELTGLTRPTVGQAVDRLLETGWLTPHAPAASTEQGGRPALRVSVNGRAAPVLGLDVGPHTVTAGVADATGERLAVIHRPVRSTGARRLLDVVRRVSTQVLAEAELAPTAIAAAVVGTPGIVEAGTGKILFAPSVPGWTTIDVIGQLRESLGCPVLVENDANLAALAMAHELGCRGTVLGVQWGERLGAGVVIDGRLHRGAGQAGEIGFIQPRADASAAERNGRGPLERVIGAEAISELARRVAARRPGTGLDGVHQAADVFAAAAAGDEDALALVDEVASIFAQAVAPAVLVLSPHAIAIGGGLARAGDVLLAAVGRHLERLVLTPPRLALSALAEETVLSGALRMALDQMWHNRLSPEQRSSGAPTPAP